jgi:cytochrome c-type biogenesis protein CcmH/NrfG
MTNAQDTSSQEWTSVQAYTLAVICLLIGIAGGWFLHGSGTTSASSPAANAALSETSSSSSQAITPAQLQKMAETQASPLLEKLKSDPNNPELLASVGNIYYDTQQYPTAIGFYQRSLKAQPANAGVRTDMATAYWYSGNADAAIAEFNKALAYEPNNANTLFNLGIVKWQGKMDIKGAVAAWQKLLETNPNYQNKDKVQQLIAQAQRHADVKPGENAKPLPE